MRIRYLKTQANIYQDHLTTQHHSHFLSCDKRTSNRSECIATQNALLANNYSLMLKNTYLFILVHLRKTSNCKNKLAINIPDICMFDCRKIYDVLYSQNGDIKGLKTKQSIKLQQVYGFFERRSLENKTKKDEQSFACFQDEEFLIMSDMDLFNVCRKHRKDMFFNKIQYIQNKLNLTGQIIDSPYDETLDYEFAGEATECFAGYKSQREMLEKYGEGKYLKYCNQKIALFLTYEQNIRINRAIFCYSKGDQGQYFLTNVKKMEFHNLTAALQKRNLRLQRELKERNKILQMSNQKYQRYKSQENKPIVRQIQNEMNSELYKTTKILNLKDSLREVIQEQRTEEAFRKLYPKKHRLIKQLTTTGNFTFVKSQLLNTSQKKKLGQPTKFMRRCINLQKRVRKTHSHFYPVEDL